MRSIDSIKTCNEKGTSKDLVCKKEEIKYNNIIKQYKKMIDFDDVKQKKIIEHNPN